MALLAFGAESGRRRLWRRSLRCRIGAASFRARLVCIAWEVQQIGAFMKRLKAIPEGDHDALYNTALFVSSDGPIAGLVTA